MLNMQVLGNVGTVGKLSKKPDGTPYIRFTVAHKYKENTTWVTCFIQGDRATGLADKIKVGHYVHASGIPSTNVFEDAQGYADSSLTLNVFGFDFAGVPMGTSAPSAVAKQKLKIKPKTLVTEATVTHATEPTMDFDDDIPF